MYIGPVTSLVAMGAILSIVVVGGLPVLTPHDILPSPPHVGQVVAPTVFENVSIIGGGDPPLYYYTPTALAVPAGARVVLTIVNFDPRVGNLPSPVYSTVLGTVGGIEQVTIGTSTFITHQLPTKWVSHTFTVQAGGLFLNVPIPPMVNGLPTTVSVTLVFPAAGVYVWNCAVLYFPVSPGMHGTLVVH